MDNSIPPIPAPPINNPVIDKGVNGVIEVVPDALKNLNLNTQQSMMLEVLKNSQSQALQNLSGSIKLALNDQLLKIPVEIKLSAAMKLPPEQVNNINIKVAPKPDGGLQVKLIAINNESPEKFVVKTLASTPDAPKAEAPAPIVNTTGTAVQKVELSPLRISNVIENLAKQHNIPPESLKPIVAEFQNVTANVKLSSILDVKIADNIKPQLNNLTDNIKQILQNFSTGKVALPEALGQIKNELLSLKNVMIPAETIVMSDKNLVMFKSPLGEILADTPLKLDHKTMVMLEIDDFIRQIDNKVFSFLTEKAEPMQRSASQHEPVGNLLKILQPLIDSGNPKIAAAIMHKVPSSDSPKLLANLVSFIKGANHNNLSHWLGNDIMEQLGASVEGRDAISRLGSMFVSSHHDNAMWRVLEIPVFTGENISKIMVAVKKIQEEDEENKKRHKKGQYGTRFVVDTTFSKLGNFQFDGYALEKEKRFDLIIRTERNIGDDFCANVMRIFKNTLHELEYVGNVKVNVKEKFIKVCDDQSGSEILKNGIYI